MKVAEYKVCYGSNSREITEAVQHALSEGWQPYGSLQLVVDDDDWRYAQAMVIYEAEDEA